MAKAEILVCDICNRTQNEEDIEGNTLHIRPKMGFIIDKIWGESSNRNIDVCDDCLKFIEYMRDSENDIAPALNKILEYRHHMCVADMREFENVLRKTAKAIDRYSDNHPKIYEVIAQSERKRR